MTNGLDQGHRAQRRGGDHSDRVHSLDVPFVATAAYCVHLEIKPPDMDITVLKTGLIVGR
ncbi:MAG: hypothetical protein P4M00_16145 [Azospirillaceae bacterium]|nr:hypothetical protein [Azospirillaceae bacterium]